MRYTGVTSLVFGSLFSPACRSLIPMVQGETPNHELDKNLEDEFKIRLMTLRDYYRELGLEYPEHQSYLRTVPQEWDERRLQLLKEGLLVLPKHFYQDENANDRMGFILSFSNAAGRVIDQPALMARHIEVAHEEFNDPSIKEPVDILAHELIHLQVPLTLEPSGIIVNDFITGKPFEVFTKRSPWFEEVEDILGGPFSQIYAKPLAKIQALQRTIPSMPNLEYRDRAYFYNSLAYGFEAAVDPFELISVMGVHFLHGRTYFQTRYSEVLSETMAEKLYDFIKNRVYRNQQEYERFPLPSYLHPRYPLVP